MHVVRDALQKGPQRAAFGQADVSYASVSRT